MVDVVDAANDVVLDKQSGMRNDAPHFEMEPEILLG
jgi:hypothetical protein